MTDVIPSLKSPEMLLSNLLNTLHGKHFMQILPIHITVDEYSKSLKIKIRAWDLC